ncbi:MAG TPA: P-loop NTPase fold protein, partial [Candidatus Angelobacter sp.]|nr:P-loop NTPase fold protein [Candidatus Angelobacter sp.]
RPYLDTVVKPQCFLSLILVGLGLVVILNVTALSQFLRRCYIATATGSTVLWTMCAYSVWTDTSWFMRIFVAVVAVLLHVSIASARIIIDPASNALLNSDRPVRTDTEDELDRVRLAKVLATRIATDEIPVIAVIGAYGDGKTSLLEMMAAHLKKQQVVLTHFKTSLPGDESTLVATLFKSVGKELHRRFFIRRLRSLLNRYGRILTGIVPSVPAGIKEIFKEASQQDELEELSYRLERIPVPKVVVMLDDMDRMQRDELQTLLKVIRGIENYPKLCFVCAFNKKALVETLIRQQAIDRVNLNFTAATQQMQTKATIGGEISADDMRAGYEYLEKFFPVQVPIPKLDDKQIGQQFDRRFEEFTSHYGLLVLPDETKVFQEKFTDLWPKLLRPALYNVRRIKTYFNALKMSYELVKNEVNLADFMCVELLRQEEPAIYEQVFKNRKFFYYPAWDIEHWTERVDISEQRGREIHTKVFDDIFVGLHGSRRENVLTLLGEMFPKVNDYRKSRDIQLNPGSEPTADREKRIYHPAHFMVYFSLHVPEGYYSTTEFETLLQMVNQKDEAEARLYFRDYIRRLENFKRMRFLDRVNAFLERLQDPAAKALAGALSRESEVLEEADFGIGDFSGARRCVFMVANRFGGTEEITRVLEDSISSSATDAFAQTILVFSIDREHNSIISEGSWAHVDVNVLNAAFMTRMRERYPEGGERSIFDSTKRQDWQALITWYRNNPDDVRAYLRSEFQLRPGSIGKYLLWLFPSITRAADGKKFVDEMFPLAELKTLAIKAGPQAYSSGEHQDEQKKVIDRLLRDDFEGGWPY